MAAPHPTTYRMIPTMTTTALEELWLITRANNQRMRVHRPNPAATDETIFVLEITDHHKHPIIHIKTKNLESAAQWLLDNKGKRR